VKAAAPQEPWFVLGLWLQKGVREGMAWSKPLDFMRFHAVLFGKQHEI
jgi:hypothetical protein